jgi:hypothetical protein
VGTLQTGAGDSTDELRAAAQLAEVQAIVRRTARAIAHADGATFVLREGELCFYADEDAMSPLWKGQRFPLTECISGWAMLNNAIAIVPDITKDSRIPLAAYQPTFVRSLLMVPVGQGDPVAAIGVYWATVHKAYAGEVAALTALADAAAEAIMRVGLSGAPFTPASAGASSA